MDMKEMVEDDIRSRCRVAMWTVLVTTVFILVAFWVCWMANRPSPAGYVVPDYQRPGAAVQYFPIPFRTDDPGKMDPVQDFPEPEKEVIP